jgi:peptidyl-prolyl cis-trans isomerase C
MKLLLGKFEKSLLLLLLALCIFTPIQSSAAQSANSPEQNSRQRSVIATASEPSDIVGKIDDYTITKEQLKKQMLAELYPSEYEFAGENARTVDANSVLMKMIAEKAMIIEARKQGHLKDETNNRALKRYGERRLVNLLVQNYLQQIKDKITATEPEMQKMIQNDPNMDPNRAKLVIENSKARNIVSQYYRQIYEKSHVKKLSENYPEVIKIHDRLLNHPKEPQRLKYIRVTQIKDETTPEERNLVLATYDGGKVTLEDWLETLCEFSPPSRPKNLNTPEGVDQLLERALTIPLYISQAKAQKLDQDENYLKQVRDYEDRLLLGTANSEIYKKVQEPTTEEMVAYYNNHKEAFRVGKLVRMDLIWCQDLETARRARAELDSGTDFESVKQKYSLEKTLKPYNTYPGSEGLFWQDLWQAEPNSIVGPVKGFYRGQIKWRIVKILEKNPGQVIEATHRPESQWICLQILGKAIIPSKFIGTWLEQLADGTIASELRIAPEKIEWQLEDGEKPLEVTMYAVEDDNDTIAYDETIVTGMSAPTGLNVVSGRLNVMTGTRKVTMRIKDNVLVVEKTGAPQQRQGMTVTPLPEEHQFKASEGKPVLSKGSKEFSPEMESRVKDKIMSDRREELLAEYRRELLKKYPHEIYPEKIKDIDPLDIP